MAALLGAKIVTEGLEERLVEKFVGTREARVERLAA
jgi:hypothetical protein